MNRLSPLLIALLGCGPRGAAVKPATSYSTVQLRGKGAVAFPAGGAWPVLVELRAGVNGDPVASDTVSADDPSFSLSATVGPGDWAIVVTAGEPDAYWPGIGPIFHVSPDGRVDCATNCHLSELVLMPRMTGLTPADLEQVDEPAPTLRWDAVDGATGYRIRWFEMDGDRVVRTRQDLSTPDPEWTFPEPVAAARTYQWDVEAYADTTMIARANAYFTTPRSSRSAIARVDPQAVWLGVQVHSIESPLTESEAVTVQVVFPDSPAAAVDFRRGDVILSVDGEPVADVQEFLETIVGRDAGTEIEVAIERDGRPMVLRPTLAVRKSPG